MSISYHSHTADVRMLIKANSLENLFAEGVKGMGNILKESFCNKPHKFDQKMDSLRNDFLRKFHPGLMESIN